METFFDKVGELTGNVKEYINNRINTAKLEIAEKSSGLIATVIAGSVVAIFIFLFFMFLGMATATFLSERIGISYIGQLIVSVIYFLAALLLWKGREKIIRIPVLNAILQQMFKDEDHQQ